MPWSQTPPIEGGPGLRAALAGGDATPPRAITEAVVRPVRAATVQLVDEKGVALPLGPSVRRADGREDVVAYDGIVCLRDVTDRVEADVRTSAGRCRIGFPAATTDAVVCHAG